MMNQGFGRYSKAYQRAAVTTVDQRKLIIMMYDGAIKFLSLALDRLEKADHFEAHSNLVRAKSIIAELLASLNLEQGGEIAHNLQRLYAYMFNELIEANLNRDPGKVAAVLELLRELREGWKGMGQPGEADPDPKGPRTPPRRKTISVRG